MLRRGVALGGRARSAVQRWRAAAPGWVRADVRLADSVVARTSGFSRPGIRARSGVASDGAAPGAPGGAACWSCASATRDSDRFFCPSCGAILPPAANARAERDLYFRLLDHPAAFRVDPARLEAAMKRLQTLLHPDKFAAKSELERAHSAEQASLVNRAYAVLRDPLARAKYMLRGRGAPLADDDDDDADGGGGAETPSEPRAAADSTLRTRSSLVDPELLMRTMEMREAIEDALSARDPNARAAGLAAVDADAREREERCVSAIGDALDCGAGPGGEPERLEAARRATVELTYLKRAREEIRERE